jgi:hypothetical protein
MVNHVLVLVLGSFQHAVTASYHGFTVREPPFAKSLDVSSSSAIDHP